jgi:hypothetical protein
MRRLARRIFVLCSTVSLLLCVAACVLWVRSYWIYDRVDVGNRAWTFAVYPGRGRLRFELSDNTRPENFDFVVGNESVEWVWTPQPDSPSWHRSFFQDLRLFYGEVNSAGVRYFGMPLEAVVLPTAAPPIARLIAPTTASTTCPRCHCHACGYDLRASPERCPECGAPASSRSST